MKVLQLTVHYHPNLGGVETHLLDLVKELVNRKHQVFVLTYRPLSVKTKWTLWERFPNLSVLRLPWIPGFFNQLSKHPVLEFAYLFPGLFLALPFVLLIFRPQVIHAHGLVAACGGIVWGKVFGMRVVVSMHSIYHFPNIGLYRSFAEAILRLANYNLCLSNQSMEELKELGVPDQKVGRFVYWVDLQRFRPLSKQKCKDKLGWSNQFVVLFLGRLVAEKGIPELLQAAKEFGPGIRLVIAGSGPLEKSIGKYYVGRVSQEQLPVYYSGADVVIVPSTHEEGFGRVVIEALACGTPVIAANRGAIPEAMDNTVGKLIFVTAKNITTAVNNYYADSMKLQLLASNARRFAAKHYSRKNTDLIIDSYTI